MRYNVAHNKVLELFYFHDDYMVEFYALIEDESYTGMGCIYVGGAVPENVLVYWKETPLLTTEFEVVRCKMLKARVYSLGLIRNESKG